MQIPLNSGWQLIGLSAALLTMFSFLPQIVKVFRTKSVKDVSLITLLQLSLGVTLWIIYGVYLEDAIIILANLVTLLSMLALLYLYSLYRKRG
jgi:MtN3 and saliva related transmembrane protein